MNGKAKFIRLILIGIVMAGIGWFGARFGPTPRPAEAKIFERLIYATRDMPAYRFDDTASSTPRKIKFNGITTYLSVSSTSNSISGILDFYEKNYPPATAQTVDEEIVAQIALHAKDNRLKESVPVVAEFLKCFNGNFRIARRDWGVWGSFELHDKGLEIGSEDFIAALQSVFDSGRFGDLGTARIAIALKDPDSNRTRILNVWTTRDFNIRNLLPDPFGDVAGTDIDGIARYPNSQRVLSLEQENAGTSDAIVAYEAAGSVTSHVLFYRSRMRRAGWRVDPLFERQAKKNSRHDLLFYTRDNRECTIQIQKDKRTGKTITLVVDRKTRGV